MSGCHLTAYIFPYLLPLIFIDQLSFGAAYVFLEVVSVSCTISWFLENQVEIALAIGGGIGNRVVSLLGFIVPSNFFCPTQFLNNSGARTNLTSNQKFVDINDFDSQNRLRFILFSLSILLMSAIIMSFVVFFYK